MGRFDGRVALITGAASGIGLACAERFAAEGGSVVGIDLHASAAWTEALGTSAELHEGDVSDADFQVQVVRRTEAEHGAVDVLITAAGIAGGGPVHQISLEDWDRVQDVNLRGTFLSCRAVLPGMLERRAGSIVTIASVEGLEGTEGGSTYNASKGGVVLLTKNMAIDYGRRGIRVNAICPGFIETPLLHAVLDGEAMAPYRDRIREQHKLGRFGRPEEVAAAALFLASEDASFVSGHALAVDGGFTAGHSAGIVELMGLG